MVNFESVQEIQHTQSAIPHTRTKSKDNSKSGNIDIKQFKNVKHGCSPLTTRIKSIFY